MVMGDYEYTFSPRGLKGDECEVHLFFLLMSPLFHVTRVNTNNWVWLSTTTKIIAVDRKRNWVSIYET